MGLVLDLCFESELLIEFRCVAILETGQTLD